MTANALADAWTPVAQHLAENRERLLELLRAEQREFIAILNDPAEMKRRWKAGIKRRGKAASFNDAFFMQSLPYLDLRDQVGQERRKQRRTA